MKKIIIAVLAVIALGSAYYFFIYTPEETYSVSKEEQFAEYFQQRTFEVATEQNGGLMPIEGYDAGLLMSAFGGLVVDDFKGVQTFEGNYGVVAGEIVFVRDSEASISTAERTLSTKGYGTLLKNLSARLNIRITGEDSVDQVLEAINIPKE